MVHSSLKVSKVGKGGLPPPQASLSLIFRYKTTVGVYSLRAKTERPYVSLPVTWEELSEAVEKKAPQELFFSPEEAIQRTEELGDLFEPVLKRRQQLPIELRQLLARQQAMPSKNRNLVSQA